MSRRWWWWMGVVLVCLAGCAQVDRAEVADWVDVADEFADPRETAYTAAELEALNGTATPTGVTWFNLCRHKECDGRAMEYTSLFREVALLAEVVRQLERLASPTRALTEGDRHILERGDAWLASVEQRIDRLLAAVRVIDTKDFGPRDRRIVEKGLALAARQLAFAAARVPDLRGRVAEIFRRDQRQLAVDDFSGNPGWPLLDRPDSGADNAD